MKRRAPRNRTLIVHEDEKIALMRETVSLSTQCAPAMLENKLIHQDFFDCIDFLPTHFIDLAIIDPPYN